METFVGWRFFILFLIFSTHLVKECVTTEDVIRQDGDVMLAALFEISEAADGGTCGELDLTGVQNAVALQWFIDGLNEKNYTPGYKIGLEIRRLCHSPERARSEAFKLIEKYTNSSQAPLFGVIGPTTTSSAVAVAELYKSLPREKRIPLISGSATGKQLGDFDDFFRVVPNDDLQVEVIIKLLIKLKWNYVALVYTDDEYGRVAAAALLKKAKSNNICVPLSVSFSKEGTSTIITSLTGSKQTGQITGVVFFGHKLDAQYFLSELNKDATLKFVKVIFSESFGLQSSKGPVPVNGSVVVTPPYREVKGFREAWNNLWKNCSTLPANFTNNPWLKKLYEGHSSNCSRLLLKEEDKLLFTWYHVQAAAVYAAALQRLHQIVNRVKVQNYTQTLNALKSHQWDLTAGFGNVSFSSNGEVKGESSQEPVYEVHNIIKCHDEGYRCFEKIGNYTDNMLTINENRSGNLPKAQCEKDCLEECIPRSLGDFSLVIQGHFYVVAVVPVHTNDENNAFQCGAARGSLGADFVEAVQYALARVNEAGSPWKNAVKEKKLGAIILDSCFSELVIKHKLLRLHLGEILTPHGLWMNETYVKENVVKNIVGYIGGFFSDISIAMSEVLTELNSDRTTQAYIHLSPTSVSDELSNRNRHPYFMRLTKSANSEAKAILELLQRLSATYVQIIYNNKDAYSTGFLELIRGHSLIYGVCIAKETDIQIAGEQQIYYVRKEIGKKPSARIVIVILQLEEIKKLVRGLAQWERDGGLSQKDNFIFMGTEAWARKTDIIEGRPRLKGSITIAEEIALDSNFTVYFKNVDPLASNNFWLRDYWEERRNCSLDLSFRKRERECNDSDRATYTQDHWIPYYIQAVYAFASGVGEALTKCDTNKPFSDCTILSSRQMVDEMKQVELDLFGKGKAKVFDDNGDGKNSYKFMQAFWNSTAGDMQYRQIGDWTDHLSLSYDVSDLTEELPGNIEPRNYATACPNSEQCGKCPVPPSQKSTQDQSQLPFIPAVVTIAVLGLLLVILLIVTVVAVRRYRSSIKYIAEQSSNHEIRFENDVLSSASSMTPSNAPTLSHVPVQEMYCRGSGPTGVAFQSQMYHHQRTDSADYATVVEAENALERPVLCGVKATANDYLTVLGTPKTERKMQFV
ncbi:uncharacterized protein [Littorina saxatilis]|uniref:uncharacterized protein isoform X2 n=1 Tax=Littorina saxatilis TaxID=31220 RepID=UPI0038B530D4